MNQRSDIQQSRAAILATLPVVPGEDPFIVAVGGFYRRWISLIDDVELLIDTVSRLEGTEDERWVPAWSSVAERYEAHAEQLLRDGRKDAARNAFLQAKTFYSLARFPSPYRSGTPFSPPEMGPLKAAAYDKYLNCFARACELLDVPPEPVVIERDGMRAQGYLRLPPHASASTPVPAALVMCGGDMYKEDRERYVEGALAEGLAALAVDAPGTGQTTFPHHPDSVVAWQGALDVLASRPEIDANRIGAFGVSRGGLWVMRLAAVDQRLRALISISPAGVGYEGTEAERAEWRAHINDRATYWFGPLADRPASPRVITEEQQREDFLRWSLKHNGLLERIECPMLLVNGKRDHMSPIGNLYLALESGPLTGRVARVYADDGHIAPKNEKEWGPGGWRWLREQLTQ
ncbi:MAG TPA: alpha/beta fold hydrolase [Pseudolabrys sp.]|nr:alpha/beta fold hydrolase [Pseudolabrys sp.]